MIGEYKTRLSYHLEQVGEPPAGKQEKLEGLLDRCEWVIKKITHIELKRENLLAHIKDLRRRLAQAEQDLKQAEEAQAMWQKQWGVAVHNLGLDQQALPGEADAVLDRSQELFERMEQARVMQGRIQAMEEDGEKFAEAVLALCKRVAPELNELPPDEAMTFLNQRLESSLTDAARLDELGKQKRSLVRAIREERVIIEGNRIKLTEMCKQAGVSSYEDLPQMERRSNETREKRGRIQQLEEELAEYTAGSNTEDFIREASQVDFDRLPSEVDELEFRIQALEEKRSELDQLIGSERTALKAMDGRADAAELAERSQEVLAELKDAVEHYAVIHMASTVLRKEIERYREAKQGPILKGASEIFSTLTSNSFETLVSDFDEQDNPILIGIRPSKEKVTVDGMSDGTCDQLYLSLRLASLEQRLLASEPIPLILDDILINFDDDRSRAALKVLANFSKKTQIIFFTHHRHLVEIAEAHVDPGVLFTHVLSL